MGGSKRGLGVFMQDEIVPTHEEAKVVVEAAGLWMMGGVEALVPFADEPGGIAGRAEPIGNRPLVERQPERVFVALMRIELVTETRLIPARQKSCARGTAVRSGD